MMCDRAVCTGGDAKLPAVDAMSPVAMQPAAVAAGQQQQSNVAAVQAAAAAVQAAGSATGVTQQQQQQSYLNPAAMHPAAAAPAGYSYYYPSAGILPVGSYYAPMIQMGGLVSVMLTCLTFSYIFLRGGWFKPPLPHSWRLQFKSNALPQVTRKVIRIS